MKWEMIMIKTKPVEKDDETVASAQKRQPRINNRAGLI